MKQKSTYTGHLLIDKMSFTQFFFFSLFFYREQITVVDIGAMGPEITFIFQFGLTRDTISVEASALTLKSLKDLACDFINSKCPDHGLSQLFDRLLLFKHDYNSTNILQLITNAAEVIDETIVEIVLTGECVPYSISLFQYNK